MGFFSHVEVNLQRSDVKAGYDTVIPRSIFSRDLGSILSGMPEDATEQGSEVELESEKTL